MFANCTIVEFDESYLTLYPHYTNGVECIGPENVEENENGCDLGDCVDKFCSHTIGFPDYVFPFTTFCHKCTNTFSESEKFTESKKFTESEKFTESIEFSSTENLNIFYSSFFSYSSYFSQSICFSKCSCLSSIGENVDDKKITFSMTLIETIVNIRTVILSNSFTLTVSHILCENDDSNLCETIIYT